MVNLSLTEKGGSTNELSFDKDEVAIGRVRGNDIVLPKGNVSKHHCRLVLRGDDLVVEDLGSTNGTYVNGRKILGPTQVALSDKIFVGDFIIRLQSIARSAEAARPSVPTGPPEAGSLSTAIPRRPPPPPPPTRSTATEDAGAGRAPAPVPPPPPPPPLVPARRETKGIPAVSDAHPTSLRSTNIDLDDEEDADSLGTPRPHFTVPPLKPAVQVTPPSVDVVSMGDVDDASRTPIPVGDRPSGPSPSDDSELPAPPDSADEDVVEPPSARRRAETPPPATREKPHTSPRGKAAEPAKAKLPAAKPLDGDVPEWLAHLLGGEGVTAAFFTGPNQAEVLCNGQRESASVSAADMAGLGAAVRKLASKGSAKPAPDATTVNVTLPDGMHIAAIFPPAADRLCVAVRRPLSNGNSVDDLLEENVISLAMRQLLDACVATRQNILVCGDHAACDAVLRAILWSVDRMARVALLSNTITPPASAAAWIKLQPDAKAADLVATAVAMQPEHIVVDANHSTLAGDVLAECVMGQKGALIAIVARSSSDALARLRAQAAPGTLAADRVDECIDLVVQTSVLADGSLKVVELAEPKGSLEGQGAGQGAEPATAQALLSWLPGNGSGGSFAASGAPSRLAAKLAAVGVKMPADVLTPR